MTTPSGVLSRILGGSTHSGSSLCSEYAPLGAVPMGCHSPHADLSKDSHMPLAILFSSESKTMFSLISAHRFCSVPAHHCSNLFIFTTPLQPHRPTLSTRQSSISFCDRCCP